MIKTIVIGFYDFFFIIAIAVLLELLWDSLKKSRIFKGDWQEIVGTVFAIILGLAIAGGIFYGLGSLLELILGI